MVDRGAIMESPQFTSSYKIMSLTRIGLSDEPRPKRQEQQQTGSRPQQLSESPIRVSDMITRIGLSDEPRPKRQEQQQTGSRPQQLSVPNPSQSHLAALR